eukprot:1154012-Pelagomonas_calceolata.AAC.3
MTREVPDIRGYSNKGTFRGNACPGSPKTVDCLPWCSLDIELRIKQRRLFSPGHIFLLLGRLVLNTLVCEWGPCESGRVPLSGVTQLKGRLANHCMSSGLGAATRCCTQTLTVIHKGCSAALTAARAILIHKSWRMSITDTHSRRL